MCFINEKNIRKRRRLTFGEPDRTFHSQVISEFCVREGGQKEKKCVTLFLVASVKIKLP